MKKIVLIEDDLLLVQNLTEILREEGFEVVPTSSGIEGLNLVKFHLPDLVICDILLPEFNGLVIKDELNKDPFVSTIPFIFLTAKSGKEDIRKGMEVGADDYLIKPFTVEDLLKSIYSRLKKNDIFKKHTKELTKSITLSLPHEFNNPLLTVLGYSEIIMDMGGDTKNINSEIIKYAGIINSAGKELHGLLKRFLLISKLETIFSDADEVKKYNENRTKFIWSADIKNNIIELSREKYDNMVIVQENSENVLLNISGEDIEILYTELLENAFKFKAKNTQVYVSESIEDRFYCLQFKNFGRGMTKEQISRIGIFQQFDRERYEQKGSGLGLSIAKRLIELNKGYLRIESLLKVETIVYLYVPMKVE
ncbi:MAG: response regulator [Bacteroidetes bacterium]|nr:response regulator [Bacteroidota bacterium]